MSSITKPDVKTWYIANNGVDVFHYGFIDTDQCLESGQPILETFLSEELMLTRLAELGVELEVQS